MRKLRASACASASHASRARASCSTRDSEPRLRGAVGELLEAALLCEIVEAPALHLLENLVELAAWDRLIDETLAAAELGVIPFAVFEFLGHGELPKRQVVG